MMKAMLAVLLLLVQLQPVVGTAACLGLSERAAQQECRMPEHGRAPAAVLGVAGMAGQSCELATLCTPAPLAVPGLATNLETAVPQLEAAGPLAATLPLGISPPPPFHPPRA
jgi:hypothetical protein